MQTLSSSDHWSPGAAQASSGLSTAIAKKTSPWQIDTSSRASMFTPAAAS
jgi:hypothetical protein